MGQRTARSSHPARKLLAGWQSRHQREPRRRLPTPAKPPPTHSFLTPPLQDDSTGFVQLTVRIPSVQRFAAYDRRGRLAAGDPYARVAVEDHWVFERGLRTGMSGNRWRVAARLPTAAAAGS